jgi:hypothetical protein
MSFSRAAALLGAITLVTAGLAATSTSDARACGFIDYRPVQPVRRAPPKPKEPPPVVAPVDRISDAEQQLEAEKPAAAGAQVLLAFSSLRTTEVSASPLETRALRVLSLSVVRGGGSLAGVRGFSDAAGRDANLEWAIGTLRVINALRHDDPVAAADLAEALSTRPKYEGEALGILEDLAKRDLMGSAHAYAALARLHAGRGDADGARADLAQCAGRTKLLGLACPMPDSHLASGSAPPPVTGTTVATRQRT